MSETPKNPHGWNEAIQHLASVSPSIGKDAEPMPDEELISEAREVAYLLENNPYHQDQERQKNAAIRLLDALSSRLAQLTRPSPPHRAESGEAATLTWRDLREAHVQGWLSAFPANVIPSNDALSEARHLAGKYADAAISAARLHSGDAAPRGEEPTREQRVLGLAAMKIRDLAADAARHGQHETARAHRAHADDVDRLRSRSGAEATSEDTARLDWYLEAVERFLLGETDHIPLCRDAIDTARSSSGSPAPEEGR